MRQTQLQALTQGREFPSLVVRRRAGFIADQGGLQLREERQDFSASQTPIDREVSNCIAPLQLDNVLGDVQTNGRNLFRNRCSQATAVRVAEV